MKNPLKMVGTIIVIVAISVGLFYVLQKIARDRFIMDKKRILGSATYIEIPRPADCTGVISEVYKDDVMTLTYKTKDGDVAVSKWRIVYEGTAKLSEAKMKIDKREDLAPPEVDNPMTPMGTLRETKKIEIMDRVRKFMEEDSG